MSEIYCENCNWEGKIKDLNQGRCPDCNSREDIVGADGVSEDDYRKQETNTEKIE